MSLCTCPERPRCEYHHCQEPADWSVWSAWQRRYKFMCDGCANIYKKALTTRMKGIDRPEGADEDWRGSLLDHLRHAEIAIAFEKRNDRNQQRQTGLSRYGDERFAPAQLQQMMVLRASLASQQRSHKGD